MEDDSAGTSTRGGHGGRRRALKPLPPRRPKDGRNAQEVDGAHASWPRTGGVEPEIASHQSSDHRQPHVPVGDSAEAAPAGARSYADVAAGRKDLPSPTGGAPVQHLKADGGEDEGMLLPGQPEDQGGDKEAYAGPVLVGQAPSTRDWGAGLWGGSGKSFRQRAPLDMKVSVHTPVGSQQEGHTPATRDSYSALIPALSTPPWSADGSWIERRMPTPRGATSHMGTPMKGGTPSYFRQISGGSSSSSRSSRSRLRPLPASTKSGRSAHLDAPSPASAKRAEGIVPHLSLSSPAPAVAAPHRDDVRVAERVELPPPKPEIDEDDEDDAPSVVSSSEGENDIPEGDRVDSLRKMNDKHVAAKLKVEKLLNDAEVHEEQQVLHSARGKRGKHGRKDKKQKEEEENAIDVLKLCIGTWNMGGKPCPDDVKLNEWLPKNKHDLYVIGVQECEAAAGVSTVQERPKWEGRLKACIGTGYKLLAKHCLGTTHLSCFVKNSIADECSDVHIAHVITGFGQVVANKAGIGLCFDLKHTSFLFVTAHFAAHMHKVHARNQDFRRIDTGLLPLMCPEIARMNMPRRASSALGMIWPSSGPPSLGLPFTTSQRTESLANNPKVLPSPVSMTGTITEDRTLLNVPSKDSMRASSAANQRTSSTGIPIPSRIPSEGGQRSVSGDIPRADDKENQDMVSELSSSAPLPPLSTGLLSSGGYSATTPTSVGSMYLSPSSASQKLQNSVSAHFDRVFWMGDFNYRIAQTRDWVDEKLAECDKKGNMHELLLFDQLNVEKSNFAVFQGFEEPVIRFRPTYKFDQNSDSYDTSKKRRVQAWTDRILFKYKVDQAHPELPRIRSMKYASIESIKASDHRPVVGLFEVDVPRDPEEQREARGAKDKGSQACAIL